MDGVVLTRRPSPRDPWSGRRAAARRYCMDDRMRTLDPVARQPRKKAWAYANDCPHRWSHDCRRPLSLRSIEGWLAKWDSSPLPDGLVRVRRRIVRLVLGINMLAVKAP